MNTLKSSNTTSTKTTKSKPSKVCPKRLVRKDSISLSVAGCPLGGFPIYKGKSIAPSKRNWVSPFFKVYLLQIIAKHKLIQCEGCGAMSGLEIHHKKYGPEHNVSWRDVSLLCSKCHRNAPNRLSSISTVIKNGKRYCVVSSHKFEY